MSEKQGGPDGSSGDNSFEERLRAARARQGLDKAPPEAGKEPGDFGPSPLGIGLRVGVELVSALVVAVAIGYWLDRWLHTSPAFLIVFVFLGGAAGVLNVWRVFAPRR
jgi:ATP synthase protein I